MVGSPPSDEQTLRSVERLVADALPEGWALRTRRGTTDRGADAEWTLRAPDGTTTQFAVDVKRALLRRDVDNIVRRLSRVQGRPVVAAPFLSPSTRDTLADRQVSYVDGTGNIRLISDRPGLFIERRGAARDPWPSDDTLRSLRGRAAGRSVRALLDFRPPYGVRELAQRAGVSLGSLSRSLDLLDREGLVTRGKRGSVVDLDWERGVRRWTQDYEFTRSNQVGYYLEPRGLPTAYDNLASVKWTYAVTGASAAQRYTPIAPARQIAVYVEDIDVAAERLHLRPADAGANVVLAEPYDKVVFERTTTRDRVRVVAASQLAADLLTGPGREPSEGNELLSWMRANEDGWRA